MMKSMSYQFSHVSPPKATMGCLFQKVNWERGLHVCEHTYLRQSNDAWNIVNSQKWWLLLSLTGDTSKYTMMNFKT